MKLRGTLMLVSFATLTCANGCGDDPAARLPESVHFNQHVRPILSDKCFPCHGPDGNKRQAELRLDVRDSALAERKGRRAIVPGDPSNSELVRRISSSDPDYRMPPPRSHRTINQREIAMLKRWVDQGAAYEPHWAYIPVVRPTPPAVNDTAWIANPIDQFVLARLEENGLSPSPPADRYTLARRLSFDLIGLPPKPEEAAEFAQAQEPAAYDQLVDRLLASPHYGERMAVDWLDLVRFADTNGYNEDQHRNIYPYRDYVIRAFNDNMPFDQFTIEQLAGDLLPSPTLWQRVASGYNRLNKVSSENGSQEKEFVAKYAADRVRTTATVWMGATLGCAECHDHKFDPYTAKDFYSFAAFFADVREQAVPTLGRLALPPELVVPPPNEVAALDELARTLDDLRAQRSAFIAQQRKQFDLALEHWGQIAPKPSTAIIKAAPPFVMADWTAVGVSGTLDRNRGLRLVSPPSGPGGNERVLRTGPAAFEVLLDVADIRFPEGTPNLVEYLQWTLAPANGTKGVSVLLSRPSGQAITLQASTDVNDLRLVEVGTPENVRSLRLRIIWDRSKERWHVSYGLNGSPPVRPFPGGPILEKNPGQAPEEWKESIRVGAIPLSMLNNPGLEVGTAETRIEVIIERDIIRRHSPVDDPPAEIAAIRALPAAERTVAQNRMLEEYYMSFALELATWNDEIDRLEVKKGDLEAPLPHTLVTDAIEPRITRVLNRGDWQDENGEIVSPAVPAFLSTTLPKNAAADRLALARWLVARDNPFTARVLVNRLWKLFFGHGIVRTLDDLGAQGTSPSHPELLDWLAAELIESGWDVKHVIRLLVTSQAYRQSSAGRPDLREIDPENELVARQSAFRLDAEMLRDNALAVSGLLTPTIGGPSVKPYQPKHYWNGVSQVVAGSPAAVWKPSTGEDQYRRGLYTYWKRTFVHPSLVAFDAPTREECVAERTRSNTPVQALVLLNDPSYVEAARVLAERAALLGGVEPESQLRWAYRQTLSRDPESEVLEILEGVFDKHLQEYQQQSLSARSLAKVGFSPPTKEWNSQPARLAALTSACRVLLNLNETITRY